MRPAAVQEAPSQILRKLVDDLGLQEKDLRAIFDADARTLDRWMRGEVVPQRAARARLNALGQLHERLGLIFTASEGSQAWLRTPSRYLGGMTPVQALRGGGDGIERADEALEALASGVYL